MWAKAPAPTRTHKACRLWAAAASCWTITWKRLTLTAAKNIYIANIVKCRPPENRDPAPEESAACLPWLRMQFRLLRPKIVVCLGRIAAQQMIGKDFSVTRDHGKFF